MNPVYEVTLGRLLKTRRVLVPISILALALFLAIVISLEAANVRFQEYQNSAMREIWYHAIIPYLIPAIAILVGLVITADDIEEGTISYFLVRPVSRTQLVMARFLAAFTVAGGLVVLLSIVTWSVEMIAWAGSPLDYIAGNNNNLYHPQSTRVLWMFSSMAIGVVEVGAYLAIIGAIGLYAGKFTSLIGVFMVAVFESILRQGGYSPAGFGILTISQSAANIFAYIGPPQFLPTFFENGVSIPILTVSIVVLLAWSIGAPLLMVRLYRNSNLNVRSAKI